MLIAGVGGGWLGGVLCDRAHERSPHTGRIDTVVRAAIAAGITIEVLPGADAVTTALVASGLPSDRFAFVGFLPRGAAAIGKGPIGQPLSPAGPQAAQQFSVLARGSQHLGHVLIHGPLEGRINQGLQLLR